MTLDRSIKTLCSTTRLELINIRRMYTINIAKIQPFLASQENVRPEDRIRHNQPDIPTPENPTVGDFGNHLIQLSGKIREYAVELSRLSDLLVRDPAIENERVKEDIRRLVQNNMDATRNELKYY